MFRLNLGLAALFFLGIGLATTARATDCTYTCTTVDDAETTYDAWMLNSSCSDCACPAPIQNNCGSTSAPVGTWFSVSCQCPSPTPTPIPTPTPTPSNVPKTCTYTCSKVDDSEITYDEWTINPGCADCSCPPPAQNNCGSASRPIGSWFSVACSCPPPVPTPTPTPNPCACTPAERTKEAASIAAAIKAAVASVPACTNRTCKADLGNICGCISGQDNFCYTINGAVLAAATSTLSKLYPGGLKCYNLGGYFKNYTCLGEDVYGHMQVMMCPVTAYNPPTNCTCFDPWATGNANAVACQKTNDNVTVTFEPGLKCKAPVATPVPSATVVPK